MSFFIFFISSGTGVQRTESSGDHRRRVRGRADHAALHGSWTANLEEVYAAVNMETIKTLPTIMPLACYTNTHRRTTRIDSIASSVICHTLLHHNPDYSNPRIGAKGMCSDGERMARNHTRTGDLIV